MVSAVKPSGLVLDLQVIRPDPRVELDGRLVCEIDGQPLLRLADAAAEAVDAAVADGRLREEAVDDHDVRKHYRTGADLVDDFSGKERKLPAEAVPPVPAVECSRAGDGSDCRRRSRNRAACAAPRRVD